MSNESGVTPESHEPPSWWRHKHPKPDESTTCTWYLNTQKKQVCGQPAVAFISVKTKTAWVRVAVCDEHRATHSRLEYNKATS